MEAFVFCGVIHFSNVCHLFQIHLLGIFGRRDTCIDPEFLQFGHQSFDLLATGISVDHNLQLSSLGIKICIVPWAVFQTSAIVKLGGKLEAVLHPRVTVEHPVIIDIIHLDGDLAATDAPFGVSDFTSGDFEVGFLGLGLLRQFREVLFKDTVGGTVPVDRLFDLVQPFDVAVGHLFDFRIFAAGEHKQSGSKFLRFRQLGPVIVPVTDMKVHVLNGFQNGWEKGVICQRLAFLDFDKVQLFPKQCGDFRIRIRPNLHFDNGSLFAFEGLCEYQRVLVFDIATVERQRFSLPSKFTGIIDDFLIRILQQFFDSGLCLQ